MLARAGENFLLSYNTSCLTLSIESDADYNWPLVAGESPDRYGVPGMKVSSGKIMSSDVTGADSDSRYVPSSRFHKVTQFPVPTAIRDPSGLMATECIASSAQAPHSQVYVRLLCLTRVLMRRVVETRRVLRNKGQKRGHDSAVLFAAGKDLIY